MCDTIYNHMFQDMDGNKEDYIDNLATRQIIYYN